MKLRLSYLLVLFSVVSISANAHEGHDHGHWSSSFVHVALYSAVAIAAFGLSFFVYKMLAKNFKTKNNAEESA